MTVVDIHCGCHGLLVRGIPVEHADQWMASLIEDCPPDEWDDGLFTSEPYDVPDNDNVS